jgi:S1-C subfamily serine protease
MKRMSFIPLFSILVAVLISTPSLSLEPEAIMNIASKFVVKIDGGGSGTGFIINKSNNRYTVLTAKHVVDESSANYSATTIDGKKHYIDPRFIRRFPNRPVGK